MRVALLVAVASICALAVGPAASASGSDLAVTYQVDVAHSGVQTDDQLVPPLGRRWTATLPGNVSYPLIAGGNVYVTVQGSGAQLVALRQSDGSTAWSATIPGTYSWASAAYDGGKVFAVNFDGVLRAFAGDTGALLWSTQLPGQYAFTSPPTASAGVVYVGGAGSGGTLYAVDESNGNVLATQSVMDGDVSSPALSGSDVFVNRFLDAATGNLIGSWAPQGAPTPLVPAVDSTTIYSLRQSQLPAQTVADGSVSWTFTGDGQLDTAPLVL